MGCEPWVRRWGVPLPDPNIGGGASACHPPYLGRAAARQPARSLASQFACSQSENKMCSMFRVAHSSMFRVASQFACSESLTAACSESPRSSHVQSRSQQHVQSRLTVRPLVRVRNFLVPLPTACCMGACCSGRGLAPAMSRSRVADLLSSCM